jgi:3-dehydroquinate synthase
MLSSYQRVTVPLFEKNKTLAAVENLAKQLLDLGADRSTYIVGVGGGITCDIANFVASIFMRGIRCGLVSTTLLSQLDASIGGKNGVNLSGYKNILGVFNQPEFVICDIDMLLTLPEREYRAGLSELIKAALITDSSLFYNIIQDKKRILSKDIDILTHLIYRGVEIKADIVRHDERESGERRKLNLGHTFAHAIEVSGELNHGEAVSVGLVIAANISHNLGLLTKEEVVEIENLLQSFELPVKTAISREILLDTIRKDKKKQNDSISFVLMNGIGNCEVRKLTFEELSLLL